MQDSSIERASTFEDRGPLSRADPKMQCLGPPTRPNFLLVPDHVAIEVGEGGMASDPYAEGGIGLVDDSSISNSSISEKLVDCQDSARVVDLDKLVENYQTSQTKESQEDSTLERNTTTMHSRLSGQSDHLLSFYGCEEIRRGTRLFTLLHDFGRIFQNAEGSAVTYSLSEPVEELDGFVSHNWVVSRAIKFLVLAFHYNVYLAFAFAYLVTTAAGILNIVGVFPLIWNMISGPDGRKVGFVARLVCGPMFLLGIVLSSEAQYRFGRRGPSLFLDKSCIHQTDRGLQRQGIEKLGAFVASSRHMIVVYSDVYLRKLWTVFELASFLMVKDPKDLIILPLEVSVLTCLECFSSWVCHTSEFVLQSLWDDTSIQFVAGIMALSLCAVTFRVLADKKAHILATLKGFTVEAASCAVEDDRPIIYASIHALVEHFHGAIAGGQAMDEETALRLFETIVRDRLPRALIKQMGVLVLPVRLLLVVTTLHVTPTAWDNVAFIGTSNESAMQIFSYFVSRFSWLTWSPACIVVAMYLPGLKLHWSGWKEIAWVGLAAAATAGTYCAFIVLAEAVETSHLALGVALASHFILIGVGLFIHRHESSEQPDEMFSI